MNAQRKPDVWTLETIHQRAPAANDANYGGNAAAGRKINKTGAATKAAGPRARRNGASA